jgi:hypothetical protein
MNKNASGRKHIFFGSSKILLQCTSVYHKLRKIRNAQKKMYVANMGGTITIQTVLRVYSTQIKWDVERAYGIMKERPNEKNKISLFLFRNRFDEHHTTEFHRELQLNAMSVVSFSF